ncbi:MAG: filamentous hemagglutinin N-terminal domain-containing protein, partial [Betaproteobacteria bacterium]
MLAAPQGGSVVGGASTITGAGTGAVQIDQATQRSIIDWRSYSIGVGESVTYRQPNASAISLNRVTGGDPSQILGALNANGQVWLVNPSGIMFGSTAQVNVAGLIASTTNISNSDFMAGSFDFNEATSSRGAVVLNAGDITVADGGLVAFVAPGVGNTGSIIANLGRVDLVSGDTFVFDFFGDGLIHLTASEEQINQLTAADGTNLGARIIQSGEIHADGGLVALRVQDARSLVENSINMDGVIRAKAVTKKGGSIILSGGDSGSVVVTGTVDASGPDAGQTGGSVKILGDKVGLFGDAHITASG